MNSQGNSGIIIADKIEIHYHAPVNMESHPTVASEAVCTPTTPDARRKASTILLEKLLDCAVPLLASLLISPLDGGVTFTIVVVAVITG